MPTNRDRLHETVRLAYANNQVPSTHAQSEGNWDFVAVEPVLAALDWPRIVPAKRMAPDINGAAYEWPNNHKIDAVLFVQGRGLVVMENKDTPLSARRALLKPTLLGKAGDENRTRLDSRTWGVYSWFRSGGGFGWIPYVDGKLDLDRDCRLHFKDVVEIGGADRLAVLARPVLTRELTADSWLDAPIDHACAVEPRFDLLALQRNFFETLAREIESCFGISFTPNLMSWETKDCRPTITKAYTDIPDLPKFWGIAYALWTSESCLQCLFYRGTTTHDKKLALADYFDDVPGRDFVDRFVHNKVLPGIERRWEAYRATGPC